MTDNVVELENLKKEIDKLSKIHHITILKIIKSEPSIVINENKNGVFLNLSEIPLEIIDKLKSYCEYLKSQDTVSMQKMNFNLICVYSILKIICVDDKFLE